MKDGLLYINNRFFVRIGLQHQEEIVEYVIPKYPPKFVRDFESHKISFDDEYHTLRFIHVGQGRYHTHVDDKYAVLAFPTTCGHPGCFREAPHNVSAKAGKYFCQEHFFDEINR